MTLNGSNWLRLKFLIKWFFKYLVLLEEVHSGNAPWLHLILCVSECVFAFVVLFITMILFWYFWIKSFLLEIMKLKLFVYLICEHYLYMFNHVNYYFNIQVCPVSICPYVKYIILDSWSDFRKLKNPWDRFFTLIPCPTRYRGLP